MKLYTKQSLINELKSIRKQGWIKSKRSANDGNIGNTLEDLLGIQENNLPIPNCCRMGVEMSKEENKLSNNATSL